MRAQRLCEASTCTLPAVCTLTLPAMQHHMPPRHGLLICDSDAQRSQDFERGGVNPCRNNMLATKSIPQSATGCGITVSLSETTVLQFPL